MRWPAGFETQDCRTPFPAGTPETAAVRILIAHRNIDFPLTRHAQNRQEPLYDERLSDLLKGENRGVTPGVPMW